MGQKVGSHCWRDKVCKKKSLNSSKNNSHYRLKTEQNKQFWKYSKYIWTKCRVLTWLSCLVHDKIYMFQIFCLLSPHFTNSFSNRRIHCCERLVVREKIIYLCILPPGFEWWIFHPGWRWRRVRVFPFQGDLAETSEAIQFNQQSI